ncbi:hypothetical protein CVT24_001808 [Panaeolus cyanescens]|uniref:DUF6697 domain-containing protein n=1 Tax=Panaeolus cyanescens TaxID=181874 RepID=A0A409YFJ7_9AGAR|nr:hypothetical protein CVT24_001808 [Panaeolus cyanescens]
MIMEALQALITELRDENRTLKTNLNALESLAKMCSEEAFQEKRKRMVIEEQCNKKLEEVKEERVKERNEWQKKATREHELQLGKEREKWAAERAKERAGWEQERVKEKCEWQRNATIKQESLLDKEKEKRETQLAQERADWDQEKRQQMQDLAMKWEAQRAQEKADWEQEMIKERSEWQKNATAEHESQLTEEKETWAAQRVRERAEWEHKTRQLMQDLETIVERERAERALVEAQLLEFQKSYDNSQILAHTSGNSDTVLIATNVSDTTTSPMPTTESQSSDSTHPIQVSTLPVGSDPPQARNSAPPPPPESIIAEPPPPLSSTISQSTSASSSSSTSTSTSDAIPIPAPTQAVDPTVSASSSSLTQTPDETKHSNDETPTLSQPAANGPTKYLQGTTIFDITPDAMSISINRAVLPRLYGSQNMGVRWESACRTHKLLTPSYEFNPNLPRAPGEPGLLLITDDDLPHSNPWTLFYKLDPSKNAKHVRWGYAGEYTCTNVGALMKDEFAAQSSIHINIISLQCVGYSHPRAQALKAEQDQWDKEQTVKMLQKFVSEYTVGMTSNKRTREDSVTTGNPPVVPPTPANNGESASAARSAITATNPSDEGSATDGEPATKRQKIDVIGTSSSS